MLLQILDDGVLTDGQGRRVDFKNCIIIMTSNVGAKLISQKQKAFGFAAGAKELEQNEKEIKDAVMGELRNTFRPEFLNRVDDIIVFQRLTKKTSKKSLRDFSLFSRNALRIWVSRLLSPMKLSAR